MINFQDNAPTFGSASCSPKFKKMSIKRITVLGHRRKARRVVRTLTVNVELSLPRI